jgi:hypothetical protein
MAWSKGKSRLGSGGWDSKMAERASWSALVMGRPYLAMPLKKACVKKRLKMALWPLPTRIFSLSGKGI